MFYIHSMGHYLYFNSRVMKVFLNVQNIALLLSIKSRNNTYFSKL